MDLMVFALLTLHGWTLAASGLILIGRGAVRAGLLCVLVSAHALLTCAVLGPTAQARIVQLALGFIGALASAWFLAPHLHLRHEADTGRCRPCGWLTTAPADEHEQQTTAAHSREQT
ncbi:hypothetical protein [Actinomadura flavalba]|uniref:hypothetical protein n=1 Tax=Actinomadura flavalba TaxID=1120938 RepID=UPI000374303C|nr:hypothetical protein [Actinomadura flavalba]